MRVRLLLASAALLSASVAAHADTFSFNLTGTSGAFSGTGTLTGEQVGTSGTYQITSISGSNTNGVITQGLFNNNDNLLTPGAQPFVDSRGIGFFDQTSDGVYAVNLHSVDSQYYLTITEINTASGGPPTTMPITFPTDPSAAHTFAVGFQVAADPAATPSAAAPEPGSFLLLGSGVLGVAGVARRRLARSK